MADSKVSALTELTGADVDIAADFLHIVDTSTTTSKKILPSNLLGAAYTTAGDIVQASGDGVAARLGIGTKRQVPMVNAGATALAYANAITLGTVQASTSGTEVDFTGIPSGVRRITIMLNSVSTNGTSPLLIQIGDAGGFETSGYLCGVFQQGSLAGNSTAGFLIITTNAADAVIHGKCVLDLENSASFSWISSSNIGFSHTASAASGGGSKSLSAELTQVRITTVNGTDAFDAGEINISYE